MERDKIENGKEILRETSYIMSAVLTITCSCFSKVHLYQCGHVTNTCSSYCVFICAFLTFDFRATVHTGQSKMATCVPVTRP